MIDLQLFKTFLAVLETGSFSASARKLDYAQPAVTKHIRQLEEAYGGVKLLERQGNRMVLTGAGQGLQSYAAQLLELYEESRRAVSAAGPRTIRLGATYALSQRGVPAAIQRIRALEPGAVLHLTNGNPEVLYRLLRGGQLDLIFVIDRPQSGQGFEAKTIRREETAVLLPPGHPLAGRPSVSFEDIRDERLILTEEGCCFRRLLLEVFAARRKSPNIVMELDSIPAIRHAVSRRQGVGFLPEILAEQNGDLTAVPFAGEDRALYSQALCRLGDARAGVMAEAAAEAVRSALSRR